MKYGFYSAKMDAYVGHAIYKDPQGNDVVVTAISDSPTDSGLFWDDVEPRGEVATFVSRIRPDDDPFDRTFSQTPRHKPLARKFPLHFPLKT